MKLQTQEQNDFEFRKEHIISTNTSDSKSKFKNFLSMLTAISHRLFKDKVEQTIEPNIFEVQATEFLKNQNYEAYINMMKQGYIPTKNQEEKMDKLVFFLFFYKSTDIDDYGVSTSEKLIELDNLLKLGYQLKQKHVLKFIQHANKTILSTNRDFFKTTEHLSTNCVFKNYRLPHLSQQIRDVINENDFSDNLLNNFKQSIPKNSRPKKEIIEQFNFILELSPSLLLKNVRLKEFLELHKNFSYMYDSKEQNALINGIVNSYYAKDMQPFYLNVKQRYTTDFVENLIVNKVKRDIEALKEIPQQALEIIQSIELTFKSIQNKSNNIENIDNLQLMVEKRIPEVLSKYLTIDPEYRTKLTNAEGKNAQNLMIDSLQNISHIFQKAYEEVNQESLHSLSATNKYTKSIR